MTCSYAATEARSAEFTQDISDAAYHDRILALIFDTHHTLDIGISDIGSPDQAPFSRLVEALLRKASRGIKIRLFVSGKQADYFDNLKNLTKAGVNLKVIDPSVSFRDQLFIFDGKIVVEGGPSWVDTNGQGLGSATTVFSEDLALQKIKRLESLPLADNASFKMILSKSDCVILPAALLEKENYFPAILKQNERDLFYLYLLLCFNQYTQQQDGWVENLANLYDVWKPGSKLNSEDKIKEVSEVLKRLSQTYGLIRFKSVSDEEAAVGLVDLGERETVWVPADFWKKGLAQNLSAAATFSYFVLLREAKRAPERPFEVAPLAQWSEDYPLTPEIFQEGVRELRLKNVIEIAPPVGNDSEKLPRFDLKPILSEKEKHAQWVAFMADHTMSQVQDARKLAEKLQEEQSVSAAKIFLEILAQFPKDQAEEVTERVASLDPLSPYRTAERVQVILEAMKKGQSSVGLVPEN